MFRNAKSLLIFLSLVFFVSNPMSARATIVTTTFDLGWLSASGDFTITPTQGATGSFTYDTDTPIAFSNSELARYSDFSLNPIAWTFNWNGMSWSSDPAFILSGQSILQVYDDRTSPQEDAFRFRHRSSDTGNLSDPDRTEYDFQFDFRNMEMCPCSPLSSTALPTGFALADWGLMVGKLSVTSPGFNGILSVFNDGDPSNAVMSTTNVPEPATVFFMTLGLAGLSFARRCRLNA